MKRRQTDDVIDVMQRNGGYSSLIHLYKNVNTSGWNTKTPSATIRRIVQNTEVFTKIKPGFYILKSTVSSNNIEEILKILNPENTEKNDKQLKSLHSYYQSVLAEIGDFYNFSVYIPPQDRNKEIENRSLSALVTQSEIPPFTYESIINRIKSIDVIWFNKDLFPERVFEVEVTTGFSNSLSKFLELRHFRIEMSILSFKNRENEYKKKLEQQVFQEISNLTHFFDFDSLEKYYENPIKHKRFFIH
jgi:hypothetical protein